MLGRKVLLHKLLVEDFPSDTAYCHEASTPKLEHDYDDCEAHISVKIEFFWVSEEHQEES